MTIQIRVSGELKTINSGSVKQSGVERTLRTIKVQDGGVLRTVAEFAPALSASASPSLVSAAAQSSSLSTNATTVSPSGGRAPYSYAWTLISSSGGTSPVALNPSLATTNFRKTGAAQGELYTATFRCTVTDDANQTATTNVSATFFNIEDFS